MADAQKAVLWAVANAKALGADPERLFLSGHSAGGNIAALLGVGPWLAPPVLPAGAVKGVIGISGVYTLLRPLGGPLSCYKNSVFDRYMRKRVFGDEHCTLVKHSPSALVRLSGGEQAFKEARWSHLLGKLSVVRIQSKHEPGNSTVGSDGVSWADELPPVLLLSASWDLGLEDDAAYFAKSLAASERAATKPEHYIIPNTNHATVSWDEASFRRCREFIAKCEANRGSAR